MIGPRIARVRLAPARHHRRAPPGWEVSTIGRPARRRTDAARPSWFGSPGTAVDLQTANASRVARHGVDQMVKFGPLISWGDADEWTAGQGCANRTGSTTARILAAAERVFATAGYDGARMAEIAAAAGLPKANLHYYFKTKEAPLSRRARQHPRAVAGGHRPDPAGERSGFGAGRATFAARWSIRGLVPDASKVFANEILHGAPQLRSFLGTELRTLVEAKSARHRRLDRARPDGAGWSRGTCSSCSGR